MLDLNLGLRPDFLGGRAEYQHRLSEGWSGYAEGWAGVMPNDRWRSDYGAQLGLRYRW